MHSKLKIEKERNTKVTHCRSDCDFNNKDEKSFTSLYIINSTKGKQSEEKEKAQIQKLKSFMHVQ